MRRGTRASRWAIVLATLGVAIAGCAARGGGSGRPSIEQADDPWFREAQDTLARTRAQEPIEGRAKNVVFFIGDGLDVATITAARIFEGQRRGRPGEENLLRFERLPHRALLKTYNANQQVADSAGSATALLAGVKTKAGVIGLDENAVRGDCASARGREVTSLFELAQEAGLATGLVTTTRITHATPAAVYAHSPERNWESDADLPERARAAGCADLARQLVEGKVGSALRVALGGGRGDFLPASAEDRHGEAGEREDGRDLVAEWARKHPGGRYVSSRAELLALDPPAGPVLGLFEPDHLDFDEDRDGAAEPSLVEMTSRALDLLEGSEDGFLLLVEAGRIDHAHHWNNAHRALSATVGLSAAVGEVLDRTDPEETLVVVTSDHGHTMTISGYPTRGNPILGPVVGNDAAGRPRTKPSVAKDGKPYTTLSYAGGPAASPAARADLRGVDTTAKNFQQPGLVPLELETHGGADVPSYAQGPWAHLLTGTAEQSYVFHVIVHAADLTTPR